MGEVKKEVIEDVLAMVLEFMDALERVFVEEWKLKNIVTTWVSLLRRLESAKPVIEEFQMDPDLSDDGVLFCNDYWFYLNTIQQIVVRFQEVRGDVTTLSDKVSISLELMSFDVRFMEDSIPKDIELEKIEVKNLL